MCRKNGDCEKWLGSASSATKKLAATVNGPLLEKFEAGLPNKCAHFFRDGKSYVSCNVFLPCRVRAGAPLFNEGAEWLLNNCRSSNKELIASLRQASVVWPLLRALQSRFRNDCNEEQLHAIAHEDWEKHRLSKPVKARDIDWSQVFLCLVLRLFCCLPPRGGKVLMAPRFGVSQGIRSDGTAKVSRSLHATRC